MSQSPSGKRPIGVAPTQASVNLSSADSATRRARLRVDTVSQDYPINGPKPDFAFVHLLERPRDGQPVVWASRGTNSLTLYRREMRTDGIAFVVTGLTYGNSHPRS